MKISVIATSLEEARAVAGKRTKLTLYISTLSYVVERPCREWPSDPLPPGRRVLGVREFMFTTELNP